MTTSLLRRIPTALYRRFGFYVDYLRYARSIGPYKALLARVPAATKGGLLIISGRGMNVVWAQIWALVSIPIRLAGYQGYVMTTHSQKVLNRYYRLLGLSLVYIDEYPLSAEVPVEIAAQTAAANSLETFRRIAYKNAPVGQIALSTYSRNLGTGLIDFNDPAVSVYVREWIGKVCGFMGIADRIYERYQVNMLFFTEVFMEEYGAFYYAALNRKANIIRFAGTVRDDAYILQRLTRENDRIHHSSIDKTTFARVLDRTDDAVMEAELMQNFSDRYGQKWHRSKRNHPNTQIMDIEQARAALGVAPGRKVAVIYSHILYDTLFFFGTDLFKDYAEWLVETARAAMDNPHIDWLIKVHPSNLWRGEINTLLKGKFEEERLLQQALGTLPPHVRIIGADTRINPFTWFQLADYGITVRGTSGLEMAALGKTVVTAGTGRYEGNGFTVDPPTAAEYLKLLRGLHQLPAPTADQVRRAKRYAHAIFALKPYTLASLLPRKRFGCKTVYASDDLVYEPAPLPGGTMPGDLARFGEWAVANETRDLLTYS